VISRERRVGTLERSFRRSRLSTACSRGFACSRKSEVLSVSRIFCVFQNGNPSAPLPVTRSGVAESWFLISMAENSPLKDFPHARWLDDSPELALRDVAGDRLESAMSRIETYVQKAFPGAKVSTAGMATTVHRLNNGLSKSLMVGFWEALV